MPHNLPFDTLYRVAAQISRAAFKGSRWVVLPNPETGKLVRAWLDQGAALNLISEAIPAMLEVPTPVWQRERASERPWEGLIFAAINAGLEQGVFGRRPSDTGTMWSLAGVQDRKWAYYTFDHCGQTFRARVEALYGGEELSLCVWLPAPSADLEVEPAYGAKLSDFAVYAHGWVERADGFYLLGSDETDDRHFFATPPLREALKQSVVTVPDFLVLKPGAAAASA